MQVEVTTTPVRVCRRPPKAKGRRGVGKDLPFLSAGGGADDGPHLQGDGGRAAGGDGGGVMREAHGDVVCPLTERKTWLIFPEPRAPLTLRLTNERRLQGGS